MPCLQHQVPLSMSAMYSIKRNGKNPLHFHDLTQFFANIIDSEHTNSKLLYLFTQAIYFAAAHYFDWCLKDVTNMLEISTQHDMPKILWHVSMLLVYFGYNPSFFISMFSENSFGVWVVDLLCSIAGALFQWQNYHYHCDIVT